MQQLTFDDMMAGKVETNHNPVIPVNVTVATEDEKRLSRQAWDIYQALRQGPKFNFELVVLPTSEGRRRFIHNMTARVSEIREYLRNYDHDVLTYRLPDGVWLYRIGLRQNGSRQICLNICSIGRAWMWNCPCCKSIVTKNLGLGEDPKSLKRSVEQNPLCHSCQTRLESSSCPRL